MRSMTGFALEQGVCDNGHWRWELRSVNARGLEIRFRTPSGFETAERDWRDRISARLHRGTITAALTLEETRASRAPRLDPAALEAALALAKEVEARAVAAGVAVAPLSLDGLLAMRGVLEQNGAPDEAAAEAARAVWRAAADAGLTAALGALEAARAAEGARLQSILSGRLDGLDRLAAEARAAAAERAAAAPSTLRAKVRALLEAEAGVEEARLAQELALLAVKSDVAEELDRLEAHLAAARELVAGPPPVGRKLDFLTQEMVREANTLCAKSQDQALTDVGLAVKVGVDQLREQAANVE